MPWLVECEGKRRKSNVVLEVCGLLYKKEGGRKEGGRVAAEEGGIYGGAAARKLVRAHSQSEVT
jgi:hypothetical protein